MNHTPAAYKLYPAICQHLQQYIKEGTVFTEMLPRNAIMGTWVLKVLIKSPSTVLSQRARCADLGASLTGVSSVVDKDRRKETRMESRSEMCVGSVPKPDQADCLCVCGKDRTTLIWPVQLLLHSLNVALIYDFYPDNLCGILAYSRTAPVSWYYVSFLYIHVYFSVLSWTWRWVFVLRNVLYIGDRHAVSVYLYWARDKQGGHSWMLGSHYSKRHTEYCLWKDRIIQRNSYCQVFSA